MIRWTEATREQADRWLHDGQYPGAMHFMAMQLINSDLLTTREFWRQKLGVPADLIGSYVIPTAAMMEAGKPDPRRGLQS